MSDLLNSASLVMIPSGYKEDIVYSEVPTNGNGDLSFTRSSNGTRINSAGLVEVVPWNLYTYSEVFSNSIWANGNATITDNTTTAPNGTLTADSIFEQAVNDYQIRGQNYSMVSGETFTFSIYAKANTRNFFRILVGNGVLASSQSAYFDLVNVTTTSTSLITSSITSVGNGWCKIVISFTCNATGTDAVYFGPSPNMTSGYSPFFGDASKSVYIWGAQINIGSTAKPYFPTTDRLNVPRLTYQNGGGGCPSLLLEKQSTNLLSYSEQFNNAYWEVGSAASVTANTTTSPDGTQNADTLTANGTGSIFVRNNVYGGTGTTCSNSVFAKKNNNRYVGLRNSGTTSAHDVFDFDTKTWTNNSGAVLSYDELPNGWFRLKSVNTDAVNLNYYWSVMPAVSTAGIESTTASNLTIYIWGGQAEQSSYPTSYIPTTSASATRVADACIKTGISSLIGQTEGTMFVEVDLTHSTTGTNAYLMQLYKESGIRILLYRDGTSGGLAYYFIQGSTVFNYTSSISSNGRHKLAFGYKSGDSVFYIDGAQVDTDATTFIAFSSLAELHIGANFNPTQIELGDYNYNQSIVFPTRLTNAELASLTTL